MAWCETWKGERPDGTGGFYCGQPGHTYLVTAPQSSLEFEVVLCNDCLADARDENPDYTFTEVGDDNVS